uniref:Variant surface glycoprotein 1125.1408 n=1 Tax=Trypanosoma brucei TaxID=5691 RepID=A0A1J0R755_9TRYP|nr:variant surface glycoprotein 1125.1408 [Trypanosoma brucei]
MQAPAAGKFLLFLAVAAVQCNAELQECTTACQCEMRATNLASHLSELLETKIQRVNTNAKTTLRLLAAAASESAKPNYLAPLAAIATEELSNQATALATASPTIMAAITRLQHLAVHYQTLNRLSITPHENSIIGTGETAWEKATFATTTLTQHSPGACAEQSKEMKNTGRHLATAKDLKFKDLKLHAGLSMTCARALETACSGVSSADKIWAQLELGQTVLATQESPLGNDGNYKRISAGAILNQLITPDNVNENQTQMIAAVKELNTITTFEDSTFFTAKDTLTNFIKQEVLGIATGTTLSSEQQKEQAAKIKANYGTEPTDFQKKYGNRYNIQRPPTPAAKLERPKKLNKLTPTQTLLPL